MDKQSNSTNVPGSSTARNVETAHTLTAQELKKLSMMELDGLLTLFVTLDEIVVAFLNKPRFSDGPIYTAAGEIIDEISGHFGWCIDLIERAATDARPASAGDAEARAWLLLKLQTMSADGLSKLVALAAGLSVAVSELEDA